MRVGLAAAVIEGCRHPTAATSPLGIGALIAPGILETDSRTIPESKPLTWPLLLSGVLTGCGVSPQRSIDEPGANNLHLPYRVST